jgi:hypothetical protein
MAKNNVAALGVASAGIIGAGVYSYRAGSRPGVPNDAQSSRSQSEGHSESEKSSGDLSSASTSDKVDNTTQSRGKARPENNTVSAQFLICPTSLSKMLIRHL